MCAIFRRMRGPSAVVLLLAAVSACDRFQTPAQRAAAAARDSLARDSLARVVMLAAADSLHARTATDEWPLPGMSAIGGLTMTPDGRLLVADEESGNVSEIDYRNGSVVKTFRLGRQAIRDEFVGIATTGNGDVFELARDGSIYHFLEGGDGNRVEFLKHDTRLGRTCDFGGVAFDGKRNSLLLACRTMKLDSDSLLLFWWRLDRQVSRISQFQIPNPDRIQPDEIALDPHTGNYVLFASKQGAIVAIRADGGVVYSVKGPADLGTTRGAAINKGTALILARQTTNGARLARYRWR